MFFLHDFQIVHRSPITAPVGLYQDTNQEPGKLTNDQHKRQDKETQSTQPEQPEKNFKRSRTTQKEEFLAKEAQRIREYRARITIECNRPQGVELQLTLFSQGFLIPLTQERSYHITVIISLLFQHSI